jgi:succinate-semialdehyde dehydrogenase
MEGYDMEAKAYIQSMVEKGRAAQKEFEKFSQEQIDDIVRDMAKVVYDNADELARMAIDETGMGVYEDKCNKNRGKAKAIWNHLRGKKSRGIINRLDNGVVEIAKPMGVVGSVTPTTNPIVTVMANVMVSLKAGNAIIVGAHPRSKECSQKTIDYLLEATKQYNLPENLVQIIGKPSIEATNELMKQADVIVATGGPGMVAAAYSSGTPAYGVGAGNVQCIIDRDADFDDAVEKAIIGRTFDNSIICSGEQNIIAHEDDFAKIVEVFEKHGGYYIGDPEEVAKVRNTIFIDGNMNKDAVGQSPQTVADMAGVKIPEGTRVLLVKADAYGEADVLSKEKMCPVMAAYTYKTFDGALEIAKANLAVMGAGHSAVIHSYNRENIEKMGLELPVGRIATRQSCSSAVGGNPLNGFVPTTTIGCGSWGGNSISANFDYVHLMNITRIGFIQEDNAVPTDEEMLAR